MSATAALQNKTELRRPRSQLADIFGGDKMIVTCCCTLTTKHDFEISGWQLPGCTPGCESDGG